MIHTDYGSSRMFANTMSAKQMPKKVFISINQIIQKQSFFNHPTTALIAFKRGYFVDEQLPVKSSLSIVQTKTPASFC
jgi:hypothetical protein